MAKQFYNKGSKHEFQDSMKCIKLTDGSVDRVRTEEADVLVRAGSAVFIKKSEYKSQKSA